MDESPWHGEQSNEGGQLRRLLNKACDDRLTADDIVLLEQLLKSGEDARWTYLHTIHLCADIERWARSEVKPAASAIAEILSAANIESNGHSGVGFGAEPSVAGALNTSAVESSRKVIGARRRRNLFEGFSRLRYVVPPGKTAALIAAVLLVSVTLTVTNWRVVRDEDASSTSSSNPDRFNVDRQQFALSESESVVARVVSATADARWSKGGEPSDFLMRLRPGDVIGAQTGLIKIQFSEGAFLLLQSPAKLQVTSATSARLFAGRVVGRAQNGNFVLLTPLATVVDIGTEFGVAVSQEGAEITVFDGEVDVYARPQTLNTGSMRLLRGMSVKINRNGERSQLADAAARMYRRDLFQKRSPASDPWEISLLDLIAGYEGAYPAIAGSIDPVTGYWGKAPWLEPDRLNTQRGDTQFTRTDWNPMVDGVFIPRANAREMQIDSDGHMVYLPPNSGTTWGPIWARCRSTLDLSAETIIGSEQDSWGAGTLRSVRDRLEQTEYGLVGLHANVGITFDLDAVRQLRATSVESFKATIVNMDSACLDGSARQTGHSDLRVIVNGKLRYSRLGFSCDDGDSSIIVPLTDKDRFLTIVVTDGDGDPAFDHVVLVDPVLALERNQAESSRLEP